MTYQAHTNQNNPLHFDTELTINSDEQNTAQFPLNSKWSPQNTRHKSTCHQENQSNFIRSIN